MEASDSGVVCRVDADALAAGGDVPDADRAVGAAGNQRSRVCTQLRAPDAALMAHQLTNATRVTQVPHRYLAHVAPADDDAALELQTGDHAALVTGHLLHTQGILLIIIEYVGIDVVALDCSKEHFLATMRISEE